MTLTTEELQTRYNAIVTNVINKDWDKAKMSAYALYRLVQAAAEESNA